jgi:hypothetical protein
MFFWSDPFCLILSVINIQYEILGPEKDWIRTKKKTRFDKSRIRKGCFLKIELNSYH